MASSLPFRQVHLDFHTSGAISDVGRDFDPDAFVDTLTRAHVNSVTCFARDHHGYLYYPSRRNPERIHPGLGGRDLLGEQIQACHAVGIQVPVYVTVQWDHFTAEEHPEWLAIDATGRPYGPGPYEPGFYRVLCVNSPYRAFLKAHTEEVLRQYPVDGIFFDIVKVVDCSCRVCRAAMADQGLDPSDAEARWDFAAASLRQFMAEMAALVQRERPGARVFFNAGHVGPDVRAALSAYSHLEIESLPSGQWGYHHFPVVARYVRTLGVPFAGHTGRFHTSWGDFHSFKNRAALEYECFRMIALTGRSIVGDQMEPRGVLSEAAYDLIGPVYASIAQKEPWCEGAEPATEIAVLTPEEQRRRPSADLPPSLVGATRMLQEAALQFDIVDCHAEFGRYRLLILPDDVRVGTETAERLNRYLAAGGALLGSYHAALDPGTGTFSVPYGVRYEGEAAYAPDFIRPAPPLDDGLPDTEHVMYERGAAVSLTEGVVLGERYRPYFNRTWQHFTSHRHAPSTGEPYGAAIVRNGAVVYFAHPVFTQYRLNAPRWCKQLVLNAVRLLLPNPVVAHDGPSTLEVYVNRQPAHNRYVIHLLHYIPERRSLGLDTIEDVIPLAGVTLRLNVAGRPAGVELVPEGRALPFAQDADGRIRFTVPEIRGHQMVAVTLSPNA